MPAQRRRTSSARRSPYSKMNGGNRRSSHAGTNQRVYIGNLPYNCRWQDLKDFAMIGGEVLRADILPSGGAGVVEFQSAEDAKRAIPLLSNQDFDGKVVYARIYADEYGGKSVKNDVQDTCFSVYVGNLDWSVEWQDLKDHMRAAGDVVRADVFKFRDGRSTGGGVVEYSNGGDAYDAIKLLNNTMLNDRPILVRENREENSRTYVSSNATVGTSVYVGNLAWSVTWQDLKDHMRAAGDVVRADVFMYEDGRSTGGGVVEFSNGGDALAAIKLLDNTMLNDRSIHVRENREGISNTNDFISNSNSKSNSNYNSRRSQGGGRSGGRGCSVFVGNLDWSVEWQDLKDHMRAAGDVKHAEVLKYRDGRSSGGGVVEYTNAADARNAINTLNDTELNGRDIFVREDRE
eukprot:GSMAST32.ASY1.ANO1.1735.1 assembled CDS